jgi:hypothetical protein
VGDVQLSELTGVLGWGSRHVDGEAVAHQGIDHGLEHVAGAVGLGGEQIHVLGRPGQQAVRDQGVAAGERKSLPAAAARASCATRAWNGSIIAAGLQLRDSRTCAGQG